MSGGGPVPANYEPKSTLVTYAFTQKLLSNTYTVVLSARVRGAKSGNPLELHSGSGLSTRARLAVPLQEMTIPAWAMNYSPDNDVRNCFRLVG